MAWDGKDRRSDMDGERIAVLETRTTTLEDGAVAVLAELKGIREEMTRYKGFLGGIAFLASGMAIVAGLFKEWILDHVLK